MSITTKTGDNGTTSLIGGERISKNDIRIDAYGTVDELNATIGISLGHVQNNETKTCLTQIQHDLFTIGAELSALTQKKLAMNLPAIQEKHITFLENNLYPLEEKLPKQTSFLLPSGTLGAAHLHLARTVCRRAERNCVACSEKYPLNPVLIKYLNRLSDLLFLFARFENQTFGEETVKY